MFDFLEEWGLINYGALPSGSKQAKEKREEAAPQSALPSAGATAPRKLCTGCRTVCGLAYFACEKVNVFELLTWHIYEFSVTDIDICTTA